MYYLIGQLKKITKPGRYPVAENLGGTNRLMRFLHLVASRLLVECCSIALLVQLRAGFLAIRPNNTLASSPRKAKQAIRR